jgi:hypothetical protein
MNIECSILGLRDSTRAEHSRVELRDSCKTISLSRSCCGLRKTYHVFGTF